MDKKKITVKYLKDLLKDIPDDYEVWIYDEEKEVDRPAFSIEIYSPSKGVYIN